jgi:hypothetical protein
VGHSLSLSVHGALDQLKSHVVALKQICVLQSGNKEFAERPSQVFTGKRIKLFNVYLYLHVQNALLLAKVQNRRLTEKHHAFEDATHFIVIVCGYRLDKHELERVLLLRCRVERQFELLQGLASVKSQRNYLRVRDIIENALLAVDGRVRQLSCQQHCQCVFHGSFLGKLKAFLHVSSAREF